MKKNTTLTALGITAVAAFVVLWHFSVSADRPGSVNLGLRPAGTYVMEGRITTPGVDFPPILSLITFDASGGYTTTDIAGFGRGDQAANGFNSVEHGAWAWTGPGEISTKSFFLSFDGTGELDGIIRLRSILTFDQGYNTYSGTFIVEPLAADADPLEAEAPFALQGVIELGRRVDVD